MFIISNSFVALLLRESTYQSDSVSEQQIQREELTQLTIPIEVNVVSGTDRTDTTRDRFEVEQIMQQSGQIWSQAGISLDYEIVETQLSPEASDSVDNGHFTALIEEYGFKQDKLQLFFVRELNGIYGIAIPGGIALVSDIIPQGSFRTTAHEIGHLLGLPHTPESRTKLLYPGATGIELSDTEINIARNTIILFYNN